MARDKVYLLINKSTNETIGVYKYKEIAMLRKKPSGIMKAFAEIAGKKPENLYRVEVFNLIE